MSDKPNAPIIIKRKKVVIGGGHHGGAWKVAYADFVTAMMAFFMLMWLLGATTEKQRKGIADFFNPTIPVVKASGGGSGAFGGDSIFSDSALSKSGTGSHTINPSESEKKSGEVGSGDAASDKDKEKSGETEAFNLIEEALQGLAGESFVSELLGRHIITRLSDEGLIIELFETEDIPLFAADGSAEPPLEQLIATIVPVLDLVTNDVALQGHASSVPVVILDNPTWSRTMSRAETVRSLLESASLPKDRIARVTGFGDRKPAVKNRMSVRNDRVEIVILRSRL